METCGKILKVSLLFILINCSSTDPAPEVTDEEKQIKKLAKTWALGMVHHGAEDVTYRFEDFMLTLTSEKKYTTSGKRGDYDYEPFKASGSWEFAGDNLNLINRNDGVVMSVQVNENALVLTFDITEENGRTAGIGEYRFELIADN